MLSLIDTFIYQSIKSWKVNELIVSCIYIHMFMYAVVENVDTVFAICRT